MGCQNSKQGGTENPVKGGKKQAEEPAKAEAAAPANGAAPSTEGGGDKGGSNNKDKEPKQIQAQEETPKDDQDETGNAAQVASRTHSLGQDLANGGEALDDVWEVDVLAVKRQSKLGKGSSGDVYLGKDMSHDRKFALKIVPITLKTSDVQPVVDELRELYGSRHPNVAAFHGAAYDSDSSSICIAFEYFDLKSLKDVIAKCKKFPEDVMGNCALQVVRGLSYLHGDRRIIHRDIKPSNVLVNSQGKFKISDFGMSKELSDTLTAGQTWVGTSSYMSPERVGGMDYSFNADIWSLGLLVFECSTGQAAYAGTNQFELLDLIVDGAPPVLPERQYSNEACDFVSLCLTKSHDERPDCELLLMHPYLKRNKEVDVRSYLTSLNIETL